MARPPAQPRTLCVASSSARASTAVPASAAANVFFRRLRDAAPAAAVALSLSVAPMDALADEGFEMSFQRVDPDVVQAMKKRDQILLEDSFKKVDFAAERRKQMDNLSKRGTPEYDATCKIEESCMPPPKDLGEAVSRMFTIMSDAELGISSNEKLEKMGMDPSERVNSKAYVSK